MIKFKKYRRTLLTIEAMQFNYCDVDNYFDKDGKCLLGDSLSEAVIRFGESPHHPLTYSVVSLEGTLTIEDGSYLAKDVNGNYYTIAKSVFEKTYAEEISDEKLGEIAEEVQKDCDKNKHEGSTFDSFLESEQIKPNAICLTSKEAAFHFANIDDLLEKENCRNADLSFIYDIKNDKFHISTNDYAKYKEKIERLMKGIKVTGDW